MTDDSGGTSGAPRKDLIARITRKIDRVKGSFNDLTIDEQLAAVLRAGGRERLDLILLSKQAPALVKNLPKAELWLTLKLVGEGDALALIAETTPEQVQYLIDIECWSKDRWVPERGLYWLRLLFASRPDKVLEWALKTDWELVVLTLKYMMNVYKADMDEDPNTSIEWPGEKPPFTLDGTYHLQVMHVRDEPLVRSLLLQLHDEKEDLYFRLLDGIIWELASDREEEGFQRRERRIAEDGFPDFEEAAAVYRFVREGDLERMPRRSKPAMEERPPKYPLALLSTSEMFIKTAVGLVEDIELMDAISLDLAITANKVLIADGDAISPESVLTAQEKVLGYCNIGLETMAEGRVEAAAKLLAEHYIVTLFQVGYTEIAKVAVKASGTTLREAAEILDSPWQEILAGLGNKRPVYYRLGGESWAEGFCDFSERAEVMTASLAVDTVRLWLELFEPLLGMSVADFREACPDALDLQLSGALLTGWCKRTLAGGGGLSPLDQEALKTMIERVGGAAVEALVDDWLRWVLEVRSDLDPGEERSVREFAAFCLDRLNGECEGLDARAKIDPRFISCVWLVEPAG